MKNVKKILNIFAEEHDTYLKETLLELPPISTDYYKIKFTNGYIIYFNHKIKPLVNLFFQKGWVVDEVTTLKGEELLDIAQKINHRYFYSSEDTFHFLIKKPLRLNKTYSRIVGNLDDIEKVKIKNFVIEDDKFRIIYKNKTKNIIEIMDKEKFEELFY